MLFFITYFKLISRGIIEHNNLKKDPGNKLNMELSDFVKMTLNLPKKIREKMICLPRVLIDNKSVAVSAERAQELEIDPEIIFIRDDGYALAASKELSVRAYLTWRHHWTHFYDITKKEFNPISEYTGYQGYLTQQNNLSRIARGNF